MKAAVVLVAVLTLASCSLGGEATTERTHHLRDGREVVCLHWKQANAGGLACDWEGAK